MKIIDINKWSRRKHFEHYSKFQDSSFAVTLPFDVSSAYAWAKANKTSFFAKYLHDCMLAINSIENLRYRIIDGQVVEFDIIHASSTVMREDNTFGFSYIMFSHNLDVFTSNYLTEKTRVQSSDELFPLINGLDCIYCSVLPWFKFSGHKETFSGENDSVPRLAFSKPALEDGKLIMNVAINVNHALVDGYHLGLFSERFQANLETDN